ncbi:uncharacterized protein EI97DRAFT_434516 [Westerdykella ornata]|uniref:Uncharacterized protein n=1 Tax=Westerdykella ornata TaxID=318751 RepID=A0A6A6JFH3_WESOR|nr:uncharacterized protein EI97DRAFT_434516 [Westerdykella ornata]KAF2275301.1 hypothetical protein EI97DRAFT_434516 [Westerdykella ornata]
MAGNWFTSPFLPLTSGFGASASAYKKRKTESGSRSESESGTNTVTTDTQSAPAAATEKKAMAKKKGKGSGGAKAKESAEVRDGLAEEMAAPNDDEWYDTATASEDGTPSKAKVVPEYLSEEQLLKYMPPLLSTNLPPCSAHVQVAYELVVTRLRDLWLQSGGHARLTDLCEQHLRDILKVNRRTGKSPYRQRSPWSRDLVFKYQQSWAEYFLREAEAQAPQLMTESELLSRLPIVPPELAFQKVPEYVVELWRRWNEGKRMRAPRVPGVGAKEHEGEGEGARNEWHEERNEEETTVDDDDVEEMEEELETRMHVDVAAGGRSRENDAHMWSEGGHD